MPALEILGSCQIWGLDVHVLEFVTSILRWHNRVSFFDLFNLARRQSDIFSDFPGQLWHSETFLFLSRTILLPGHSHRDCGPHNSSPVDLSVLRVVVSTLRIHIVGQQVLSVDCPTH